jgi:hypothetical protein
VRLRTVDIRHPLQGFDEMVAAFPGARCAHSGL